MVRFDDGTSMRLYRQTVQDFGLYPGLELSQKEYAELKTAAGEMSAKMRSVRIVSASSVSKGDLERRLVQKGEDPDHARKAVQWMSDLNLVDDAKTAEQIVQRCAAKGYGVARAKQALYEKRIPKAFWQQALEDYPDQGEAIVTFLRNHLTCESDQREIKRAVDALLRRGHSYSQIRRGLEQLSLENDFSEEF